MFLILSEFCLSHVISRWFVLQIEHAIYNNMITYFAEDLKVNTRISTGCKVFVNYLNQDFQDFKIFRIVENINVFDQLSVDA